MLDFQKLVEEFQRIGIEKNQVLLVHSSFKSFGGVEGGPQTVIDALLHVLGDQGTLIVPRFNFDFSSNGTSWDIRNTPSHMGIISEFVRTDPRSLSVFHPIYSFSIIGKYAKRLTEKKYKGSYSSDSIFHQLRVLNAKILQIDLVYKGATMIHHVEEMVGVDYRYHKDFTGFVTDENGQTYEDTFDIYVRDWEKGFVTDVLPIGKILEEKGVSKVDKIGNAITWFSDAEELYQTTKDAINDNQHILCKIIPPSKDNEFIIKNYSETLKFNPDYVNSKKV